MTLLGAIAGYYLKKASEHDCLINLIKNKYFYFGAIIYLIAAIVNIVVLRVLPYSVVLPLTGITYIWTMFIARFLLKENISIKKILGVCMIILGAFCVAL
jgi:drug/metabolite transporter (DMT)-like permease